MFRSAGSHRRPARSRPEGPIRPNIRPNPPSRCSLGLRAGCEAHQRAQVSDEQALGPQGEPPARKTRKPYVSGLAERAAGPKCPPRCNSSRGRRRASGFSPNAERPGAARRRAPELRTAGGAPAGLPVTGRPDQRLEHRCHPVASRARLAGRADHSGDRDIMTRACGPGPLRKKPPPCTLPVELTTGVRLLRSLGEERLSAAGFASSRSPSTMRPRSRSHGLRYLLASDETNAK
jgi:hypothetical protein